LPIDGPERALTTHVGAETTLCNVMETAVTSS